MPMMRDMPLPARAERVREIVDDRPEKRARGERVLETRDRRRLLRRRGRLPRIAELARDARLFVGATGDQALALLGERGTRRLVELAAARFLQRLLDLEHLFQELRRRLRL